MSVESEAAIESARDMEESGFTPILRALLQSVPGTLAVVFVDGVGEAIDYCSVLPPFDAKVIAAHMTVVSMCVRDQTFTRSGEPWFLHIHGSERDVLVRRVADDYSLAVVTRPMGMTSILDESVERAVRELRAECSMDTPAWEPVADRVRVEIRLSTVGWAYAPKAYWQRGLRIVVDDVLGRWVDVEPPAKPGEGDREQICFLVRTARGHELTLVHWVQEDAWEVR